MKRTRILVLPSDTSGCGFYRSLSPHKYLSDKYGDEFLVDIDYGFANNGNIPWYFADYDIIHFHKTIDPNGILLKMLKEMGKITICDVDDYWDLGPYHPMSITAKHEKWHEPIINHLKMCDYVTTTTNIFANKIKQYNKNVVVLPNAINPDEEQFKPKEIKSDKVRIGMICGSSHFHDINLLKDVVKQLKPEILDKIEFVLCGFDTRGEKTLINPETGEKKVEKIMPNESVWCRYESIVTDNYNICSPEYANYLKLYANIPYVGDLSKEHYRRYWTKDIHEYATHYNNIDVLLAPLVECDFNKMKSQLKVIEAGFFNKAIIAQNFGAYTIDLINGIDKGGKINPKGNGLLVDSSKNHKQWAKYITKLVEDENLRKMLADNLTELVKKEYSLENVTKKRAEFYRQIVNEKLNKGENNE